MTCASLVLCAAVLVSEGEVLHKVNDLLVRDFIGPDGLLLDYVGEIPTPQDVADLRPNAMGWWCPIENGSMFTGEWLPALMAEGEGRKATVERCVRGLLKMNEISSVPGFIARGTGTDGRCHFPCGSNDQTDPWFFGLLEYCRWQHADPALRTRVLERAVAVAKALEANGWGVPCDGPFAGENRGNLNSEAMPFWGKSRLLYTLKSLSGLTGDRHWQEVYERLRATALDGIEAGGEVDAKAFSSCYTGGVWIYVSSAQMLARLIEMEQDEKVRTRLSCGFARFAARVAPLMAERRKYDNAVREKPFRYANWRAGWKWRPQKTQRDAEAVAYSPRHEVIGTRKEYERHGMANPLAAAAICALQGDAAYRDEIRATLAHYDYETANISEFFHAAIAATKLLSPNRPVGYVGAFSRGKAGAFKVVEIDSESGSIVERCALPVADALYFAVNKARTRLYVACSDPSLGKGGANGGVAVYALGADGMPGQRLDLVATGRGAPCHLSLSKDETRLVFAEYDRGTAGWLDLKTDGTFAQETLVTVAPKDPVGPDKKRQDRSHCHCAQVTPDGKYTCIVDLGTDRVKVYAKDGRCVRDLVTTPAGAGPRHILFHPNGHLAFVVFEMGNLVTSYRYDDGVFTPIRQCSLLPDGYKGGSWAAAVKLSPDGRQLFCTNRGHNSLAVFDVNPLTGELVRRGVLDLGADFPWDLVFLPDGKTLAIGFKRDELVRTYRYDAATCRLTPLGTLKNMGAIFGMAACDLRARNTP